MLFSSPNEPYVIGVVLVLLLSALYYKIISAYLSIIGVVLYYNSGENITIGKLPAGHLSTQVLLKLAWKSPHLEQLEVQFG